VNPIRNETTLVLLAAAIFSAVAIFLLSGFLEPSQPPAVAAVQIGEPRDEGARGDGGRPAKSAQAPKRERPAREAPKQPAPEDDVAEDDGGEAD
jgi:hypothetical protein